MLKLTYPSKDIHTVEEYYACIEKEIKAGKLPSEAEYCFWEFMEGTKGMYEAILDICCRHDIAEVHDIGCSTAPQAVMFANEEIFYVGIESLEYTKEFVPRGEYLYYLFKEYPNKHIPLISKRWRQSAAISSLCVGYLCKGEEVWRCMHGCHEYFIGYVPKDEHEFMLKYYEIVEEYPFEKETTILFCKRRNEDG